MPPPRPARLMPEVETRLLVLLLALAIDAALGDPEWLWRRLPHPVVLMGRAIAGLDRGLNRETWSAMRRRAAGVAATALLVLGTALLGLALSVALARLRLGWLAESILVAVLLAQRSLYEHVAAVAVALERDGLEAARTAVSRIVGRDPAALDEAGVARAAIESLAENTSDGVVAPAFWYALAGLPGLLVYKAVNTADSMIGHRTPRHAAFGFAAARLDDLLNLAPARLSGVLIALAAFFCGGSPRGALRTMWRDAPRHTSPNAGWPEAAMAGALGIALAGPRSYHGRRLEAAWMNPGARRALMTGDIRGALRLYVVACSTLAVAVAALAALAWRTMA